MQILIIGLVGVSLGSFINALVWRIHEQAINNKKHSELSIVNGRSMCPDCRHELTWIDLIPVISWLSVRGKCRYCKKPISWQYPAVEILFTTLLIFSYLYWPYELNSLLTYAVFGIWTLLLTILTALALYDLKWMILPSRLIYLASMVAIVFTALLTVSEPADTLISAVIGSVMAGGFFWLMYQFSGGKWIGGGDVRYGFLMGIILGWPKTLFALMLAAYLGTAVIIVIALMGKYHKKMRLPFGPFLIAATYISLLFGQYAIDLYKRLSGL